jgi:tricorn protease
MPSSARLSLPGLRALVRVAALVFAFVQCTGSLAASTATPAEAPANAPLWLRYPAISPDGQTIAFTYGGQLWRVPAAGGEAVALTQGEFFTSDPVWSPDGGLIAFASKRHGNLDVFILHSEGLPIVRLTANSADDRPTAFSPDGTRIYFSSQRLGSPQTIHVGTYAGSDQLYSVSATGGRTQLVLPTPALHAAPGPGGRIFLYENRPVYENLWRKGSVSDAAHDIWLYDAAKNQHRALTDFRGEDREPVWSPDGRSFYYLSERSGSFNIWKQSLRPGAAPEQVTRHRNGAVRFLSVARDGTLAYGFEGEIWCLRPGQAAQRVPVQIRTGTIAGETFNLSGNNQITEMALSRDATQVAVIARGEVFVHSPQTGTTRRITRSSVHERHVSFGPDGRSLVYVSERDGDMDIFEASLGEASMTDFTSPGPIVEKKLIDTEGDVMFPKISPDGRLLAYLADRRAVNVYDRATGTTVAAMPPGIIYSYVDEDQSFQWSSDSRWLAATAGSIVTNEDIVILDASGKLPPTFVTRSGYNDSNPGFSPDGRAVLWATGREGLRQADTNTGQTDVFMAYLTREAFDAARSTTPEERKEILAATAPDWRPQAAGIDRRTTRLTPFSASIIAFTLTPDFSALLLVDQQANDHAVVRRIDLASGRATELLTTPYVAEAYEFDATGSTLFALHNATIERTDLASGKTKVTALDTRLDVEPRAELTYWFTHFWRLTKFKFYEPTMHGRDWDALRTHYARFLPHLQTWEDFAEMMSELAGELNASHMGCYYLKPSPGADETASLGVHIDDTHSGAGLRIAAVLPGGPADITRSALQPGAVILAINGEPINADADPDPLLNALATTRVELLIRPADGSAPVRQTIVPITPQEAGELAAARWVEERKTLVEKLSGGRLGYVHLPAMDLDSYKRTYSEVTGDYHDKEGLLIDVRYNMGGNLHDQLITLFTGEVHAGFTTREDRIVGRMPTGRWAKKTALLQNAGAYSDGSIFPHLYKRARLGPVIGDRVPGTGTAVWWMFPMKGALKWGIPQLGAKDFKTGWFENFETVPDVLVRNDPASLAAGRDPQLEAAVAELLRTLPSRK